MVSLHKIIELCGSKELPFRAGWVNNSKKPIWMEEIYELANCATCFDMGPFKPFEGFFVSEYLHHLPYPICWFEGVFSWCKLGCLCHESKDDILLNVFFKEPGTEWYLFEVVTVERLGNGNIVFSFGCEDQHIQKYAKGVCDFVAAFLQALKCTNVKTIENNPPAKLQKKRKKQGKVPLFLYHTLHLDIPNKKNKGESLGGTHASPRLHLRRGHTREYQPGKFCWVQPCMVGDIEKGFVGKDYQARTV